MASGSPVLTKHLASDPPSPTRSQVKLDINVPQCCNTTLAAHRSMIQGMILMVYKKYLLWTAFCEESQKKFQVSSFAGKILLCLLQEKKKVISTILCSDSEIPWIFNVR